MANLAQTINVLQAVILTDKEKMILTPTYHVMEMYNVHQDAKRLNVQSIHLTMLLNQISFLPFLFLHLLIQLVAHIFRS